MTATLDLEEDGGATFSSDRLHERLRLSKRDEPISIAVDHQQRRIGAVDELDGTRGSRQRWMLLLQQTLMLVSTAAAGQVLQAVRPLPAALSFALNFVRRGREVSNGCVVIAVALAHEHFAS
mgnify:CR=1 FL=1